MHRSAQPSFLSAEESPKQNYRGLFNLAFLILVVSNLRMLLKNLLVYGLLLKPLAGPALRRLAQSLVCFESLDPREWPILGSYLLHHACLLASLAIERSATRPRASERLVRLLHVLNCAAALGVPTLAVWHAGDPKRRDHSDPDASPSSTVIWGALLCFATIIIFMKLVSYAHVNNDYRLAAREAANVPMDQVEDLIAKYTNTVADTEGLMVRYPYNLTLQDLYYFWLAPTLTYQLNFPRSPRRRGWMVATLLLRALLTVSLMTFFCQQHIMPSVAEATGSIDRLEPWHIVERLLYVAMPVTYTWLLMFYLVFHLFLNLLAELLRFGDRVFYKDWWNATTFEEYWRLWNLPVHYWMVRHLYFPLHRAGLSRGVCVFVVFLYSAAFHELLVSVPFHMPRLYAFGAMLGQIPLVALTKRLQEDSRLWREISGGNFLFWATFCVVGQPMAVLLYYYDYCVLGQAASEGLMSQAGSVQAAAKAAAVGSITDNPAANLARGVLASFGQLLDAAIRKSEL